ncbi:MAG TPA: SET domain-containing protein-lysine N-methyltransferase [Terriglobales bacterium]|nr:SET domain-containing protein-lysine N-methyltransferase [Terriglobales bacterium]
MTSAVLDWLHDGGGASSVLVEDGPSGRVLRAAEAVPAGELLLVVPRALLVTIADARRMVASGPFAAALGVAGPYTTLALFLLDTLARGGPWHPYVAPLARHRPRTPPFFTEAELAELAGSWVVDRALRSRRALERSFAAVRAALPASTPLTYEQFASARALVLSRVFEDTVDGVETQMLAPIADLADHHERPEASWCYDAGAGAFVLVARRDVAAGELVHISYGRKSAAEFLLMYGFVPTGGARGVARLRLPRLPPGDALGRMAAALGVHDAAGVVLRVREGDRRTRGRLLTYLRLVHASPAERRAIVSAGQPPDGPLSPRTERAVARTIAEACTAALRGFPAVRPRAASPDDPGARDRALVRESEQRVLRALRRRVRRRLRATPGTGPGSV